MYYYTYDLYNNHTYLSFEWTAEPDLLPIVSLADSSLERSTKE